MIKYIPPGGIPPIGGLGGGGPLIGAPTAPPGGPGIELGPETGGPCCGGPPVLNYMKSFLQSLLT